MADVLYEVIETVGLPEGHLGPGAPDVLYVGTLVSANRLGDLLGRLIELGAIAPAPSQTLAERLLAAPQVGAAPAPLQSPEPSSVSRETMTVAELRLLAESMGVEVPARATRATILNLIEAAERALRDADGQEPPPVGSEV